MKFLNRYELMEPVTGGAVETFVARDIASGERVIVHMFAGSEVLPDKPPLQWALQSLRGLAPTPMGSVIEGGRYEQTSHAYLVTRFPADPVALQHWIQFYTLQSEGTQPTLGTPAPIPSPKFPASASDPEKSQPPIGEFTKAFFGSATADVDSHSSAVSDETAEHKAIPDPPDNWSRRPAGAFTKEFLSSFDVSGEIKKPSETPASKQSRKPQAFTAELLMAANEGRRGEERPAAAKKDGISALFAAPKAKPESFPEPPSVEQAPAETSDGSSPVPRPGTGEFTNFFRGPFAGQSTSGAPPDVPVAPPLPQRKRAGEFTQLFGSGTRSIPGNEGGALLEPAAPRQSGNFTEVFGSAKPGAGVKAESPGEDHSVRNNEISWNEPASSQATRADSRIFAGTGERPATFREPGVPLAGAPSPASGSTAVFANEIAWDRPMPAGSTAPGAGSDRQTPGSSPAALEQPMRISGRSSSGATLAFTPPGGGSSPAPPAVPSGPSEFTRIISPPQPPNEEPKAPGTPAQAAAPASSIPQVPAMPTVQPPAMPHAQAPQMPHLQTPQAPHIQLPHIQAPQMPMHVPLPAMQPPQAPQAPQPPQASGGAQNFPYWPLIIVMNVLLILAVALILYFALKH